jgi:hypothetical protein
MTRADEASEAHLHEQHELIAIERRMLAAFSPPLPPAVVSRAVAEVRAEFDSARVRKYVPLLVERRVSDLLRAAVRARPRWQLVDATELDLAPPVGSQLANPSDDRVERLTA